MVRCRCLAATEVLVVSVVVVVMRLSTISVSLLMRRNGRRALHRGRHGSANRHQHGKQDQQPDT